MSDYTMKIHVLHTGQVCVAPDLPFGGENCSYLKGSGVFAKKSDRLWLPVSVYLIEHPKGLLLVDCGWHRDMSPNGVYDKKAQIRSLGSRILYHVNQGKIETGAAVNEQLERMGLRDSDIDYVLLTHLDCDHANGLKLVSGAKHILVARDELAFAQKPGINTIARYRKQWWDGVNLTPFDWNGTEGPVNRSYDLFGDGSVQLINIPGHADGLFAVKLTNPEGKFVLLFSDGGYAKKSWEECIPSGIAADKKAQIHSLKWIAAQSKDPNCIESLANHDPDVTPHTILL